MCDMWCGSGIAASAYAGKGCVDRKADCAWRPKALLTSHVQRQTGPKTWYPVLASTLAMPTYNSGVS